MPDECQVALIRADMSVADGRLSTLETAMQAIQEQLLTIQQQPVAAVELEHSKAACQHASDHGAEQAVVSSVRLEALEAGLAEMKLILLGLQKAQSAAAGDEEGPAALQDCSLLQNARLSAQQAATTGSVSSCRVSELQDEMNELKQRVADLSLSVCGIDSSKSRQGGAVEEAVLPFMESTSNCLQQHEQQLDEIQVNLAVAISAGRCKLLSTASTQRFARHYDLSSITPYSATILCMCAWHRYAPTGYKLLGLCQHCCVLTAMTLNRRPHSQGSRM